VKVNRRCEMLGVAKPACFTLDRHDFAIEALGYTIGDWMTTVPQQTIDMSLERCSYAPNRLQPRAPRRSTLAITPQRAQRFLNALGSTNFQIERLEGA
jgi:hypothetical protein